MIVLTAPFASAILAMFGLWLAISRRPRGRTVAWHGVVVGWLSWMLARFMCTVYAQMHMGGIELVGIMRTVDLEARSIEFLARSRAAFWGSSASFVVTLVLPALRRKQRES